MLRAAPAVGEAAYAWEAVGLDPDAYLTVTPERDVLSVDQIVPHGTAFCVSREGILLTNAHVVAGGGPGWAYQLLDQRFLDFAAALSLAIGGEPSETDLQRLAMWFVQRADAKEHVSGYGVVLKYGLPAHPETDAAPGPEGGILERIMSQPVAQPLAVPVEVLAVGEPLPGKDVAVLRIAESEALPAGARDRLICLPIYDSNLVTPGSYPIQALGFPAAAFNPTVMWESAEYRVNAQNGQIVQTRGMIGGWDAFEMTALINHGHSGGPVVNRAGSVVGLNVGVAQEGDSGRTLAVPIDVAKAFLRQAGITAPDPGPLGTLWTEALRRHAEGEYAGALAALTTIMACQSRPYVPAVLGAYYGSAVAPPPWIEGFANPYVEEMWGRSFNLWTRAGAGALPPLDCTLTE